MHINLRTPISENDIRRLRVGDIIYLTGTLITARDLAHKRICQYLRESRELPFNFDGLALFHCGPLVKKVNDQWTVVSAGPTTSMRMEPFEHEIIEKLGVRLVIGKGGMGEKTKMAMVKNGSAYGVFTGGAAALASKYIRRVLGVEWMDLGMPEAAWTFEVEKFGPLVIAIDSHGGDLFEKTIKYAEDRKAQIFRNLTGGKL
ncbi:fumarate hydratase C-terminal domain-containing protein [Candidatus Bathyarchaeota archaeon]|nr:fumarate hydratase C-terminal domain-containing protein [Candidatus Bathyarchaeota archaeon]